MKFALLTFLLIQLAILNLLGTTSMRVCNDLSKNSETTYISSVDRSSEGDDAIRPSILLGSVERSRDRRRTLSVDKVCYSQNMTLGLLSEASVEKFYDVLFEISEEKNFVRLNSFKEREIPRENSARLYTVFLI